MRTVNKNARKIESVELEAGALQAKVQAIAQHRSQLQGSSFFFGESLPNFAVFNIGTLVVIAIASLANIANLYLVNYGFNRVEAHVAGNILTLETAFALVFGILIYQEIPVLRELLGSALIIFSVYQMNRLESTYDIQDARSARGLVTHNFLHNARFAWWPRIIAPRHLQFSRPLQGQYTLWLSEEITRSCDMSQTCLTRLVVFSAEKTSLRLPQPKNPPKGGFFEGCGPYRI